MVLSTDKKVSKCDKHASKTITTICLDHTCKDNFMCIECIKQHDKTHFDNWQSIADIEGDEAFIAEVKARRKCVVEDFAKVFIDQETEMEVAKDHIMTCFDKVAEAVVQKKKSVLQDLSAHFVHNTNKVKDSVDESISSQQSSTDLSVSTLSTEDAAFKTRMHQLIDFNFEPENIISTLVNVVDFNKIESDSKEMVQKYQKKISENLIKKERIELYKNECLKIIGQAEIELFKSGRKFDFETGTTVAPDELTAKEQQISELTTRVGEMQAELETVKNSIQTLETEKTNIQNQLNQANQNLNVKTTANQNLQNQVSQVNASLTQMTTQRDQLQTNVTNLTSTNTSLQNQITNLNNELTNLRNSQSSLNSTISSLQSQLSANGNRRACGIVGKSGSYDVYYCNGKQSGCTSPGGTVWGTNVYTSDSSKCRAGLHSGMLSLNGGIAYIENLPGQSSYQGTTQNGETTNSYGSWGGSYQFRSLVKF